MKLRDYHKISRASVAHQKLRDYYVALYLKAVAQSRCDCPLVSSATVAPSRTSFLFEKNGVAGMAQAPATPVFVAGSLGSISAAWWTVTFSTHPAGHRLPGLGS